MIRGADTTSIPLTAQSVRVGDKEAMLIRQALKSSIGQASKTRSVTTTAVQCDHERRPGSQVFGPIEAHRTTKALNLHIVNWYRLEWYRLETRKVPLRRRLLGYGCVRPAHQNPDSYNCQKKKLHCRCEISLPCTTP